MTWGRILISLEEALVTFAQRFARDRGLPGP
jgi:hypothetical protein